MAELLPPTGLRIESFVADNIVEWQRLDNSSVVGYNVYAASTPGGGQSRFVRLNNTIVNIPDRVEDVVEDEVVEAVETPIEGGSDRVEKVSITRQRVRKIPVFRFRHRNVDINSRLFYVVTSVDASGNESGFSAELTGETARIDAVILEPGRRTFGDIVNSFLDIILRRNPEIDLKPGTVARDLMIDPQAFEMEKMWFFISFIDKSTSLMALRDIDDEDDDSITDPVPFSQFKQDLQAALSLSNDEDTQAVVDFAVEKLAANANVVRKRANRARGEALFFSETRPVADVEIPVGTRVWTPADADGAIVNFTTSSTVSVRGVDVDTHFNAAQNRFEFPVLIEADNAGPSGNVSVGAIVNTTAGVFSVTNPAPTFGGDFEESNSLFTERAVLKYSSLDVGTRKGYRRVLLEQPGVRNVFVADAGHPLMQRDFIRFVGADGNVRSEHIFGRVDLWVRGEESVIFEDRPSFLFSTVADEQFQIVEFVSAFVIETANPDVTEGKPIFEVLKITRRRAGVPDQDYLLDNLVVPDGGRRIEINTTDATNVAIGLQPDDTILVTYRFRGSDPIKLSNQPATSVISVEGLNSGTLDEGVHYEVLNQADFLLEGRSVRDTVSVQMKFDSRSRRPIGTIETFIEQEGNETGFVLGDDFKELSQRGILVDTVSVVAPPNNSEQLQLDNNIAQVANLSRNRDFETETDEATGVTNIRLIGNEFPPGRYIVSYEFGETIIIRYRANNLISRLQGVVDKARHEAADVLVKASRPVDVDVIFSFKILETSDAVEVKQLVMEAVRNFVSARRLGESLFESDLIHRVQQVDGVKHLILPLLKLARVDSSYETNEEISTSFTKVVAGTDQETGKEVSFWQTNQNALKKNTLGTSAEPNEFWGLRENGTSLTLVPGINELAANAGSFFIDVTGTVFVNPKSVDEVGNAFNDPDPNNNTYEATYRIVGEAGSQNIIVNENEFARLADLIVEIIEA